MHEGVIRDEERTRIKRERQEDFDLQAALREQLLKVQNVKDTSNEGDHRNTLDAGKS
jgi:protein PET117